MGEERSRFDWEFGEVFGWEFKQLRDGSGVRWDFRRDGWSQDFCLSETHAFCEEGVGV